MHASTTTSCFSLLAAGIIPFATSFALQAQTATLNPRGSDDYRSITDVRELSSGRLLISDTEGGTIWALTADGKRSSALKSGSIQAPGRFHALSADSTLVFSRASTTFMVLTPEGALVPAPASLTPPEGAFRASIARDSYATNGRGDLYWSNIVPGAETMPLQRRTNDGTISTPAMLRSAPSRQGGDGGIRYTVQVPFSPVDEWEIADNGDIILARGEPYRIDRLKLDGTIVTGKTREYAPVPVTTGDREQVARDRQRSGSSINLGGVALNIQVPDDAWPKNKPAFGRNSLRAAPDGSVWVKRHVAADSPVTQYDVFGRDGAFREAVALPARSEVVGFGKGVVFVSVRDGSNDQFRLHTLVRQ